MGFEVVPFSQKLGPPQNPCRFTGTIPISIIGDPWHHPETNARPRDWNCQDLVDTSTRMVNEPEEKSTQEGRYISCNPAEHIPNLVSRNFIVLQLGRIWVTDINHVPTWAGCSMSRSGWGFYPERPLIGLGGNPFIVIWPSMRSNDVRLQKPIRTIVHSYSKYLGVRFSREWLTLIGRQR